MLDIGWQELFIVAVVTVVVVGPKELPRVLRTANQWLRKARSLAREFQSSLDELAREAELDDLKKQIADTGANDIAGSIEKSVDPTGTLKQDVKQALDGGAVESEVKQALTTDDKPAAPSPEPQPAKSDEAEPSAKASAEASDDKDTPPVAARSTGEAAG
jgi:sec-independent protein translocase protein TatB